MKILITGASASGKSVFSKYLAKTEFPFQIVDFDRFYCLSDFINEINKHENCIVVYQRFVDLKKQIDFDRLYNCSRTSQNSFTVAIDYKFDHMKEFF